MTTTTQRCRRPRSGPSEPLPAQVTQWRVIVSEWIKLRSLRSTVFSLLAAVVCTIGLGILISALRANDFNHNGISHRAAGSIRRWSACAASTSPSSRSVSSACS